MFIFNAYTNVTEDLLIEQNRDSARFQASQFNVELREYEDLLIAESRVLGALQEQQLYQQRVLASSSNRFAIFDSGVVLLDNYGKIIAAEPERPEILSSDWSNRTYYNQIARSGLLASAVFSNIVSDGPDDQQVIVVAVPVTDVQNRFIGVLAGMFRIGASAVSSFYGDIVKLNWGAGGSAYIVDGSGNVIYHTDMNEIGKDVSNQDAVISAIHGESDALRTIDLEGKDVLASFAPIPGTPWGLVTEQRWQILTSSNEGYRTVFILLLVLGIAVPSIIVSLGVKRITKPIAEVSSAAKEIAAGKFSHRINIKTSDELEEMSTQFNTMAGALEELYTTLEQKVEDRTRGEHQRADQLRTINEVGRKISSILSLDELLPFVAESLQVTFKYYNVSIIFIEKQSGELILKASAGARENSLVGDEMDTITSEIARSVAHKGEPLVINDLQNNPKYHPDEVIKDTRAEMVVPIKIGNRIIGILEIEESRINAFDELDLFTAQTLADQLAIAIENARLYEHARELATIEERNRLARDLHDAVSQTLFSASLISEVLPRLWERNPNEGRKRLEEVRELTRGALAEMRTLLLELRPSALIEAELPHLLTQLAESIQGRTRIPVSIQIDGECSFPSDVKVALYRIAQEAFNNAAKHALATQIIVNLRCESEKVTVKITDDGKGFDINGIPTDRLGIGIMRERARDIGASLSVQSCIGKGTEIIVVWDNSSREGKE